jgi:hypothetical protein
VLSHGTQKHLHFFNSFILKTYQVCRLAFAGWKPYAQHPADRFMQTPANIKTHP